MITGPPLFAAKGDPVLSMLFGLVVLVMCIVWFVQYATSRPTYRWRGGLPWCGFCGRQVSLRRDICRACGGPLRVHGPDPAEAEHKRRQAERHRQDREAARNQRAATKAAKKRARQGARDQYWVARGVEPGRLAFYRALPDWGQAIALGLAIGSPIGLAMIAFFLFLRWWKD